MTSLSDCTHGFKRERYKQYLRGMHLARARTACSDCAAPTATTSRRSFLTLASSSSPEPPRPPLPPPSVGGGDSLGNRARPLRPVEKKKRRRRRRLQRRTTRQRPLGQNIDYSCARHNSDSGQKLANVTAAMIIIMMMMMAATAATIWQ